MYEEDIVMSLVATYDQTKADAFVGTVLTNTSGFTTTVLAAIGDRLDLWKTLAASGPVTSQELAERAGITERYAREWLGGMAAAGYLTYEPAGERYTFPAEHAPVLADEGGPAFLGGIHQVLLGWTKPIDRLIAAFRDGGGVPLTAYDNDAWEGLERFTAGWFNNLLLQQWLPAMPEVTAKLERGALVADVGCGGGRGLIALARAFPRSRFVGYDVAAPAIARANANAAAAGVADRVRFVQADVTRGLPEQYDIITTFDVIHDAVDPLGLLRAIRQALAPDGHYICLEINSSPHAEENVGPLSALQYGSSVLYCMTTSLAHGGEGLGTLGLPEPRVRELSALAGFGSVRRLPLENPFNILYEIRP
jgi:2-polyprenyl-3-methyl-5-hydroxy-6-metoxy-1,4-benzoquinol methylase